MKRIWFVVYGLSRVEVFVAARQQSRHIVRVHQKLLHLTELRWHRFHIDHWKWMQWINGRSVWVRQLKLTAETAGCDIDPENDIFIAFLGIWIEYKFGPPSFLAAILNQFEFDTKASFQKTVQGRNLIGTVKYRLIVSALNGCGL